MPGIETFRSGPNFLFDKGCPRPSGRATVSAEEDLPQFRILTLDNSVPPAKFRLLPLCPACSHDPLRVRFPPR